MWNVVRAIVADGATVLLTTQYLEEADALADRITVIDRGRVIADDTPDALKRVVGGQTLSVRPADPARLPDAEAILRDVTGARRSARPAPASCRSPVAGDEAMAAVVGRLAAARLTVTELSLHLPSLDEVFFTLTGRQRREVAAGPSDQRGRGRGGRMTTVTRPRDAPAPSPIASRRSCATASCSRSAASSRRCARRRR